MKNSSSWIVEFGEFIIILCVFISFTIKLIYNGKDTTNW